MIDIIMHMYPIWLNEVSHQNDDEDEDTEEGRMNEEPHLPRNTINQDVEMKVKLSIHMSTGDIFPFTHITSNTTSYNTPSIRTMGPRSRLGIFSQLLLRALKELRLKRELRRDADSTLCLMKSEVHSNRNRIIQTRKIYITPSMIHYEGPYFEETCVITRQYEPQQDQFLRVIFRDEGEMM